MSTIRRPRTKRHKPNAEINVVPYIDVMMVLLVIFMVTAPMLTQGVNVDLPKAKSDPVASDELRNVTHSYRKVVGCAAVQIEHSCLMGQE